MNAADRSALTHTLIRKQAALEQVLASEQRSLALAEAEVKKYKGKGAGATKLHATRIETTTRLIAEVTEAIAGRAQHAEWMLSA
jgi:hypothetical protein